MINRPFRTVLARLGLVAAVLATLLILAPVASAADPLKYEYEENGDAVVETFTANDEDADAGDIAWDLEGVDADIFTIDGGELAFKESPDFEEPKDGNEDPDSSVAKGAGDNVYKVTVVAEGDTKATQAVEVTVTDAEEEGEVTFDQPQPQATRDLMATLDDDDGEISKPKWQWSKSMDKEAADDDWMVIAGASTRSRSPVASDVGYYLRASVSYTDRRGSGKMASGVTDNPVEERTLANAAPKFPKIDPIPVDENVKGDIGDPLVAPDKDNDVVQYFLDPDYDAVPSSADTVENDNGLFKMSKSGQLSLTNALNFESPGDALGTPGTARTANTDGVIVYNVGVMAKDPSGAPGRASVMVYLRDVNESPEFDKDLKGAVTLYINENDDEPAIFTNDDGTGAVAAYEATDNDGTKDGAVEYTLEGADAKYFKVGGSDGLLAPAATGDDGKTVLTADFEDKSSYSVVIVASTTGAADATNDPGDPDRGTKYGSLDVTIKVIDGEDAGVVMLSAREPQEGRAVLATLDDDDGGETAIMWKWFRSGVIPDDDTRAAALAALWGLEDNPDETTNRVCDDAGNTTAETSTGTAADVACVIAGAESALYTPDADGADRDKTIHAVASYKDARSPAVVEYAGASSERAVQESDPANTAPSFPDQDLNTAGDQSDTAMRSVAENQKKGTKVGEPITAVDADLLIYTLSGPNAASFDIGSGLAHDDVSEAQIVTTEELDYESKPMHTVIVTATDPTGATDAITVTIMVTNEDDPPMITTESVSECSGNKPVKCDYMENGDAVVETFTANDEDADAGDIAWDLEGVDADIFTIDGGELAFKESPDFEEPKDGNEDPDSSVAKGAGDNVYKVTVVAEGDTKATQAVEVTVTDAEEEGEVTFDQPQPQATRDLMATLDDDDGEISKPKWQWSKSMDKEAADDDWMVIAGASTRSRSPVASDVGYYLRASVSYTDRRGSGKMASGVTDNPVEERTLANAAPKFPKIDPIPVDENVKGDIGDPLVAPDKDNDVVQYFLDPDYDAVPSSADTVENDNGLFKMSKSGQLSLTNALNFESPGDALGTPGTARTANTDGVIVYNVGVMAKDPSGAPGRASVMVYLRDVNESPEFDKDLKGAVTLYINENDDEPAIFTNDDGTGAVAAYEATDNDGTKDGAVEYTLEGADAKYFKVGGSDGLLAPAATGDDGKTVLTADFEDKSSYSVVIVASTTGAADATNDPGDPDRGTKYGSLDVTIKVIDGEDAGVVMLSAREPQEGRAVLATLDDDDGGETAIMWKWFRSGVIPDDDTRAAALAALWGLEDNPDETTNRVCDDAGNTTAETSTGTAADVACVIAGAESALYTPDADGADRDKTIHAVASYKDARSPAVVEYAGASSERAVQESDPANTAPSFPDQDLNTAGDQSDTAMRSVAENQKKGTKVGEPITAVDADLLIYTLSGPDAASFDIGSGLAHDDVSEAQIVTTEELDYESKPMHTVIVTATDPTGATDAITVTIMVTNEDDPPMITTGPAVNTPPAFDAETAERMVAENMAMANVGDPVAATDEDGDTLTYTIGGDTGGYFAIDGDGQITTAMALDYEAKASHAITVTADDGNGGTDTIAVTIMVGDMYRGCMVPDEYGVTNDCEVLLGVMDDLVGAGSLNWDEDTPIEDWTGVDISGDAGEMRVTQLRLHGQNLSGVIPAGLGYLGGLELIYLHSNRLHGTIPGSLGMLTNLEQLRVDNNELEGIEMGLGGASSLERLFAHRNHLQGEIPADLGDLDNLEWLRLDSQISGDRPDDGLTGGIPAELANMDSIERLYLHRNKLSGDIPAGLGMSTTLTHITLQQNDLSGTIPDLSGMTSLVWLGLYSNELSGIVPVTLGMLSNLERLYLHDNDLTGSVPASIGDLTMLTNLWLANNNLTGALPSALENLVNLDRVRISGNSFTGCVPAALDTDDDDIDATGLEVCGSGDGS